VVGVGVFDATGRLLGRVREVYRAGETDVYSVDGGPLGAFELPAVRTIIRDFAPREDRIVIDLDALAPDEPAVDQPSPRAPRRRPRWSRHGKGPRTEPPAEAGAG
jgi:hypothetical protein